MRTKTSVGRDFQDDLLGALMDGRQVTTLYLRNRMSLRGRILTFDPYVLVLDPLDGTAPQMVYKSAVVSISGPRRMQRGRGPGGPGGPGGSPRRPGGPYASGPRPGGPPYGGPRHEGPRYEGPPPRRPRHEAAPRRPAARTRGLPAAPPPFPALGRIRLTHRGADE